MIAIVKIFPIANALGSYLNPIDVTQHLAGNSAISNIKNSVDSSDFVIGSYTFASVKVKLFNPDGRYSLLGGKTIFPNEREGSKVEILVTENDGTGESLVFTGLINDAATKDDILAESITFTITSPDSILSRRNITSGSIRSGLSYRDALIRILNARPINTVLNVNTDEFVLDVNGTVENAAGLEGLTVKEAVDQILLAANAVLIVDRFGNLTIRVRTNRNTLQRRFFGPYDPLGRTPRVLGVKGLNTGLHRTLNTVVLNGREYIDQPYIDQFGVFKKDIDLDFITSESEGNRVARNLIDRFRYPKREMSIIVPIRSALDLNLLSLISVDYRKRVIRPRDGASRYGADSYNNASYTGEQGAFNSNPEFAYIVYEVNHRLSNFTSELKIREFGKTANDVTIYNRPDQYGLGRYGESVYQDGEPNYASQTGNFSQGRYGSSKYGE